MTHHLSQKILLELSLLAQTAAMQAGKLISDSSQQPLTVQQKKGGDQLASQVVTEIDRLSQEIILRVLMPSCRQYGLGFLTEESEDNGSRFERDYFWSIDPLDGTLPFIEKKPGYSVSIGLVSKSGEPILGIVYDPSTEHLYSSITGQGLRKNGVLWRIENRSLKERVPLTLVCDRTLQHHSFYPEIIEIFNRAALKMGANGLQTIHHGGAVLNGCWVLENHPACYFKFPKKADGGGSLWDFAATAALFAESHGCAINFRGKSLDLNQVGSTFMNHHGVILTTERSLIEVITRLYRRILI